MKGNYLNWVRRLIVLGAVVAGMTAPAAGSATNPAGGHNTAIPDVIERYAAAHPYGTTSYPDWIERYAAAHPFGSGLLTSAPPTDRIVDDSFRDQPTVVSAVGDRIVDDSFRDQPAVVSAVGDRIVDDSFRDQPTVVSAPPTDRIVDDSFRDQPAVVSAVGDRIVDDSFRDPAQSTTPQSSVSGLNWGDFGIGAGAMLGLMVLVAGLGLGAHARHRSGTLGTS
jgi:hypothetical protein